MTFYILASPLSLEFSYDVQIVAFMSQRPEQQFLELLHLVLSKTNSAILSYSWRVMCYLVSFVANLQFGCL